MVQVLAETESRKPEAAKDMIFIPGGTFRMGSDQHYREEAPVHRVTVDTSASHVGFHCIVRDWQPE